MESQFLGKSFFEYFKKDLQRAKKSLTIISPFVTQYAVNELLPIIQDRNLDLDFVTRPPGVEYVNGSINPRALLKLSEVGFNLWAIKKLHSKIYIIDDKVAYIGSANFTENGIEHNIEDMVKVKLAKIDLDYIQLTYLSEKVKEELLITEQWIINLEKEFGTIEKDYRQAAKEINNIIIAKNSKMFSDERYTRFLTQLVTDKAIIGYQQLKGSGKNVYLINNKFTAKLMVSKKQLETKEFEANYRYALSIYGKERAVLKRVAVFIMMLEEDDQYQYVCLPRSFLEQEFLIKKNIDGQKRFWQFQISLNGGYAFLRSKGKSKKKVYDISQYRNQIKIKYTIPIKLSKDRSVQ